MYRYIMLLLMVLFIASCGGTQMAQPAAPLEQNKQSVMPEVSVDPIDQIIASFQKEQNITATTWQLLEYARTLQQESKCLSSEIIVSRLFPTLTVTEQVVEAEIIRSECALLAAVAGQNIDINQVRSWLGNADDMQQSAVISDRRIPIAKQVLQAIQSPASIEPTMLMQIEPTDSVLHQVKDALIWRSMMAKSESQKQRLARNNPQLTPYLTMLEIINDSTLDDRRRQQQLRQWLSTHQPDQFALTIPSEVIDFVGVELNQNQNIAVLLPLSGALKAQGEAIRHGMLAAFFNRQTEVENEPDSLPSLVFFDTGSDESLRTEVTTLEFSKFGQVIGPLLPSHVEALASAVPSNINHILLNLPASTSEASATTAYFGLSPEQEAIQVAQSMISDNIQNPILIYAPNARAQRMRTAFIEYWESKREFQPSDVSFTDNKSMRVGITAALGVLQSEQRIQQISRMTSEKVHSVTRNRRDVDAFVVFADAQQAELINPIIESSISLFDNISLPVYASSFSYSHKLNKNSLRDLRNMIFLDMPFIQPNQRDSQLARQVDEIFQQPSTGFLRLFAFGYDAYNLVSNSLQMNTFNMISYNGLSGSLSIEQHTVERRLSELEITESIRGE